MVDDELVEVEWTVEVGGAAEEDDTPPLPGQVKTGGPVQRNALSAAT